MPAPMPAPVPVPVLRLEDLHVWFDLPDGSQVHAVRGVDLDLAAGERVGLVGESGCGKTTTILAILGLLPENASVAGCIALDGEDILAAGERSISPHRWRDIAMVFQGAMNAFNPVRTVGDQIVEPMELHGVARGRAAQRRAEELLALVGIPPDRAARYPHEFSGGMRQRAAIAMALACEPRVLLADEPTTALDVIVQAQILRLLRSLADELGLSLVLVTHDLPVVAQTCSRAAVMYAGTMAETGPVDALYHEPRHPYTRRLFQAVPDLGTSVVPTSIPGVPPRLDRPIAGCAFAPRCDEALPVCAEATPRSLVLAPGHSAACHLNEAGTGAVP